MSKKEKPLPKPPASPFGAKRRFEEREEDAPLMADQMAQAMAEGKLDAFLKREMPDNEHARKLATMMLGMTGMLPPESSPSQSEENRSEASRVDEVLHGAAPVRPPEDVLKAVQEGDMQGLTELLKREHEKRSSGTSKGVTAEKQKDDPASDFSATEKETIGTLMEIASKNDLTLDWIVLRALKRYIEEYRKTGLL